MATKQRQQVSKETQRDPSKVGKAGVADKAEKLVTGANPFIDQYLEKRDAAADEMAQQVADLLDPTLFWQTVADRIVEKTAGFDYSCPFVVPEMQVQRMFIVRGQQLSSNSIESGQTIDIAAEELSA